MQTCGLNAQLAPITGRRQPYVPHVEFEVEILVLDPIGMIEIEGHVDELLPEVMNAISAADFHDVEIREDEIWRAVVARRT